MYPTHIEDGSQATQYRKRFHEYVMQELGSYLVNKYGDCLFSAYVINDEPRRIWIRISGIATVVHGTNG